MRITSLASKWFTHSVGLVAIAFALFANLAENLIQAVQHRRLDLLRRGARACSWWRSSSSASGHGGFLGRAGGARCWSFAALSPRLSISYLWYNLIGCAACVLSAWRCRPLSAPAQRARRRLYRDMSTSPVICFGQQPCGFFPRRFLFAKIQTARRLQAEIGGEIVFFYHDSDHDPRETRTTLRHRKTGEPIQLNSPSRTDAAQVLAASI